MHTLVSSSSVPAQAEKPSDESSPFLGAARLLQYYTSVKLVAKSIGRVLLKARCEPSTHPVHSPIGRDCYARDGSGRTLMLELASTPRLIVKFLAQLIQQLIEARVRSRNHPAMCVVHDVG